MYRVILLLFFCGVAVAEDFDIFFLDEFDNQKAESFLENVNDIPFGYFEDEEYTGDFDGEQNQFWSDEPLSPDENEIFFDEDEDENDAEIEYGLTENWRRAPARNSNRSGYGRNRYSTRSRSRNYAQNFDDDEEDIDEGESDDEEDEELDPDEEVEEYEQDGGWEEDSDFEVEEQDIENSYNFPGRNEEDDDENNREEYDENEQDDSSGFGALGGLLSQQKNGMFKQIRNVFNPQNGELNVEDGNFEESEENDEQNVPRARSRKNNRTNQSADFESENENGSEEMESEEYTQNDSVPVVNVSQRSSRQSNQQRGQSTGLPEGASDSTTDVDDSADVENLVDGALQTSSGVKKKKTHSKKKKKSSKSTISKEDDSQEEVQDAEETQATEDDDSSDFITPQKKTGKKSNAPIATSSLEKIADVQQQHFSSIPDWRDSVRRSTWEGVQEQQSEPDIIVYASSSAPPPKREFFKDYGMVSYPFAPDHQYVHVTNYRGAPDLVGSYKHIYDSGVNLKESVASLYETPAGPSDEELEAAREEAQHRQELLNVLNLYDFNTPLQSSHF